ncbi:MAG: CopD family protein [Candidatus Zeuxoniibacter abyssi]|nr:MAG: CopD family protein [Candidatus Persebacteraceae bacterium AB1(2)]
MLWIKTFHIVAVVSWFAGLLYLPRLFVYHAECDDEIGRQRFCVMEKRLFWRIMTPAATAAVALGLALLGFEYRGNWIIIKIILVLALLAYHAYCGVLLSRFAAGKNPHRSLFLRLFNEIPALLLLLIVGLVVFKPF